MTALELRREASRVVALAGVFEQRARTASSEAERLYLTGRALIARGRAYKLYAKAMA